MRLTAYLPTECLLGNYCALELKGSHSMGDGGIFLKTRRDVSLKKGLSNEPTFGLIHLAGQYLLTSLKLLQSWEYFLQLEKLLLTVHKWMKKKITFFDERIV